MTYPYYFAFGNNEKRATLKGRACRIIARGTQNSHLVTSRPLALPEIQVWEVVMRKIAGGKS